MLIKSILIISLLASASSFASPSDEAVKRGKIMLQGSKASVLDLQDNAQLKAAGLEPKDVILSVCDVKVTDMASWKSADQKIQSADSCEVKIEREKEQKTLKYQKD